MVFDRFKKIFSKSAAEVPANPKIDNTQQDAIFKEKELPHTSQIPSESSHSTTEQSTAEGNKEVLSPSIEENLDKTNSHEESSLEKNAENTQNSFSDAEVEKERLLAVQIEEILTRKIRLRMAEAGSPPAKIAEDSKTQIQDAMQTNNHAVVLQKEGKYTTALEGYNKAIKLYPQYAIAYYNRALLHHKQDKLPQAMEDYNKAIELNSRDPEFYNNRANGYFLQKEYDKALEDYNQAISLFPNYSEAYHNRAQLYAIRNQIDEAIKDCTRAIELNPDLIVDYYNLACLYACKGDAENAFSYLEKSLKKGYRNFIQIQHDPDWQNLRNHPTYGDILYTWSQRTLD